MRTISADFDKNFKDGYPYGVYAAANIHEERLAVPVAADTAPEEEQAVAEITKAVPGYTPPEGLAATEGGTLADITLPEGWAWEEAALSVGGAGEKTFTAVFTPSDTANYESVTMQLSVTVASAEPLPDTNPDAALTGGEIAGIAVGSVVGAALIGTGIFFLIRKRRKV